MEENEEIIGIVDDVAKDGKLCSLYFTSSRIIVANLEGGLRMVLVYIIPIIGILILKDIASKKRKKLEKLSGENILKNNKKNFEIPYSEITKIETGKSFDGFILINTPSKKYEFEVGRISVKKTFDNLMNLVRLVMPDKIQP